MMRFAEAVRLCFARYFTFSGRAGRPEFWWFVLFVFLGNLLTSGLDVLVFGAPGPGEAQSGLIAGIFSLVVFFPLLAAAFRRLQDTGRPGWYALLPVAAWLGMVFLLLGGFAVFGLVATQGAAGEAWLGPLAALGFSGILLLLLTELALTVVLIWWCTRPGTPGPNAWGPAPPP